MKKDFDRWNASKKKIDRSVPAAYCHPREVWWCSLGVNVGVEQDGTGRSFDRPVVVVKGFNQNMFFCLALTGKKKSGKFYFSIGMIEGREATAVLSQARTVDTKRLIRKMTTIEESLFEQLCERAKEVLF